jgi:hypothetical protein
VRAANVDWRSGRTRYVDMSAAEPLRARRRVRSRERRVR